MLHTLLVTDFSIAAAALRASQKVPPLMTAVRRDGSAVSFGMSVSPKEEEEAPPEGDARDEFTPQRSRT